MLNDLDETLKQLLVKKAGLEPAEVDISFDIPTRDWSTSSAATRPTVNLYLYDVRENLQLRELFWDEEENGNDRVRLTRRPVRVDLSYMVTCWTSVTEDQHRLLWRVLETFFRHSPLPEDVLQGELRQQKHPIRTLIAQPDGVLKNVSDFWGALENQLRPSVSLTVTLDLDLNEVTVAPLVLAGVLKYGQAKVKTDSDGRERLSQELEPGWEAAPVRLGGMVKTTHGEPVQRASVRLVRAGADSHAGQFGSTTQTDQAGHYVFNGVPPGEYTLIVQVPGQSPHQQSLTVAVRERGEALPELVQVEVPMKEN